VQTSSFLNIELTAASIQQIICWFQLTHPAMNSATDASVLCIISRTEPGCTWFVVPRTAPDGATVSAWPRPVTPDRHLVSHSHRVQAHLDTQWSAAAASQRMPSL